MQNEEILVELYRLSQKNSITKNELMKILKKYARTISVHDLMLATARMRKDGEFIHAQYREKYLKIYLQHFLMRMKEISTNNSSSTTIIDKKSFDDSFPLLKTTFKKERSDYYNTADDKFPLIYVLTSLYTTFILEEPIHPVGSEFPGSLKVEEKNGVYYCPVKDKQNDNPNAICHLCLAKQTPGI